MAFDGSLQHPAVPRGRILIVEDDESTRRTLGRLLERAGFTALHLAGAAEATAWAAGDDLSGVAGVVIDVHLGDGDGVDLTRRLRDRLGGGVPIVVVSGDTSMDLLCRLGEAGATRFVAKPMSLRVLQEALGVGDLQSG